MAKFKKENHIKTITTFGQDEVFVSCGVMGSGKTYSACFGLGLLCKRLKEDCGLSRVSFLIAGKTQKAARNTVGKTLKKIWGENYVVTKSDKDGYTKDALLFGQCILYIGNDSKKAEESWRGNTDILGAYVDEMSLLSKEQYLYLQGRLRGEFAEIKEAIAKLPPDNPLHKLYFGFMHGSTNPDSPDNWVKKELIDEGKCVCLNWMMEDACWNGAEEYHRRLLSQYKPGSLHYRRYCYNEWCGAEGMVYSCFDADTNVLNADDCNIDYTAFKRIGLGIDYGSNHPTAVLMIGVNSDNIYIVLKEWTFTRTAPSELVQNIEAIMDEVRNNGGRIDSIYVDPSAGALKDELKFKKINYTHADNKHEAGIGCINTKFHRRQLYIMSSCPKLIKEIHGYTYKDGTDEVNKIGDDLCDALRYYVYPDTKAYNTGGDYY